MKPQSLPSWRLSSVWKWNVTALAGCGDKGLTVETPSRNAKQTSPQWKHLHTDFTSLSGASTLQVPVQVVTTEMIIYSIRISYSI